MCFSPASVTKVTCILLRPSSCAYVLVADLSSSLRTAEAHATLAYVPALHSAAVGQVWYYGLERFVPP